MANDQPPKGVTMKFFSGGCNSLLHPADLPQGQYHYAENVINRGGMVQSRPGFKLIASIMGVNLQGFCIFTPKNSTPRLVVAVDGVIYSAQFPTYNFDKIEELKFSATEPIITFQSCLQSAANNPDGSIRLIDPTAVLIIQDGVNAAGMWNGSLAKHLTQTTPFNETKTGLWMAWVASRLWVANDNLVFASDIANPLSFTEEALATRSGFEMPFFVTGMVETADQRSLLVFTDQTTTSLLASIRDRATWQTTTDFQRLLFQSIGCIAGRTACNQYGMTFWLSASGLMSLDAALYSNRTANIQVVDSQMMRSKRLLASDPELACAIAYENLLMVSVPSGDSYNAQTWLLDQSPIESGSPPVWAGIWTGVRPMQWAKGVVAGQRKLLFASFDKTSAQNTHIHIWEAMRRSRLDADGPISSQFYTAAFSTPGLIRFRFSRFEAVEILGEVELNVFMAGTRGPWFNIGTFNLSAEIGSLGAPGQKVLTLTSILQAFRPQSRTLTTNEFSTVGLDCTPEMNGLTPGRDKGFRLLFEWRGRMGIREVTLFYSDDTEPNVGACPGSELGQINMINERGEEVDVPTTGGGINFDSQTVNFDDTTITFDQA